MGLTTHWSRIEELQGDGAAEAWHWFIDRYRDFVTVALRRLVWSTDRAVTAGDEFWGYLFQSGALQRASRPMHFRGFLMSTVRNYALHWMRRNPKPQTVAADGGSEDTGLLLLEEEEVALWARQILLGTNLQFSLLSLPSGAGPSLHLIGFGSIPGGVDLSALGAGGCSLYLSLPVPDVTLMSVGPVPTRSLAIPNNAGLLGLVLHSQSATAAPAANAFGAVTSNAVKSVIGNR